MKDKKVTKKIVLIGDAGVGKTSIVRRFVTGLFNPEYIITLGTTIMKKEIEYIDTIVNLAIWDIGGQSVFKAVRSKYYFASEGALAICDRCNRKTIENLPSWIDSFREVVGDKPVIIVGNKSDLPNLEVSEEEIKELADKYKHAEYILTSAKDGTNVEKTFLNLTRLMFSDEEVFP